MDPTSNPVTGFLTGLQTYLFVAVIAIALGALAGYTLRDKVSSADKILTSVRQVKRANKNAVQSAKNVVESHEKSGQIEEAVAKGKAKAEAVKAATMARIAQQQAREAKAAAAHAASEPQPPEPPNEDLAKATGLKLDPPLQGAQKQGPLGLAPGRFVLDFGTVCLLDTARKGSGLDATGGCDAKSEAPSAVGLSEFVSNDLDVVQMYHELAERHNELVEAVEQKLKDDAKRTK